MIERTILTSQQEQYTIASDTPAVVEWFTNEENQTDTILKQINTDRLYDPIFQGRKDMVVIDLGANAGLFSLYAQDSAARVIAVEPAPATFAVLSELTKQHDNVTTVNAAVSNSNETVPFYLNENSTTNSLVSHNGKRIDVPGVTIEDLIKEHNLTQVDFVKCDIEGSELLAITDETLAPVKDIVKFWFVELHQTNNDTAVWPGNLESNRQQIKEIFERNGYETDTVIHDQLFAWR
jgi:FkbM family methyltransferase